jgi:hypothetical protein
LQDHLLRREWGEGCASVSVVVLFCHASGSFVLSWDS